MTPGKLVAQDLQRQRDTEEEKRQQAAAAAARTGQLFPHQLAQEQETAAKATNAGLERTMRADIGVSAQHPELAGKPFAQIDPYYRQSLNDRYGPVADKIAPAWEAAQAQTTGGIPGLELHGASMDQSGNVTKSFTPKAAEEPQFDDFTTPQDVQAAMPESEASLAEQIGTYKVGINALGKFPANKKMQILRAAKVYNPDFDVKEFNNLNRARQAYTTGAQGQNIAAINTAIGHLGQLAKLSKQLNNRSMPAWNTLANEVSRQTGDPAVTSFEQTKEAVASELAKVFKGAGVTSEAQMREWRKAINSSMSPEQLKEGIANAVHLMGSRVQEIDRQWDQLTKAPRDYRVLSDPNKRILQEIGFDPSELDPTGMSTPSAPAAPEAAPQPEPAQALQINSQAEYDALPSGAKYRDSAGKLATKR